MCNVKSRRLNASIRVKVCPRVPALCPRVPALCPHVPARARAVPTRARAAARARACPRAAARAAQNDAFSLRGHVIIGKPMYDKSLYIKLYIFIK